MHLRLALNLLYFLPDVGAFYAKRSTLHFKLYALRFARNFYEIHPN
jgi:hypothetical protein